jgi:thiol-disulfide isomerase/thioredoxin
MNKAVLIIPAVAIAAVLGALTQRWVASRAAAEAAVSEEAPPVAGAEAAAGTGAGSPPATSPVPDTLPAIALADAEGQMRALSDWAGRPLMINYWATWCAPCRREIPLLNELRAAGLAPNLEVIGIAVDFREDVLAYAKETPIDYPLLIGEEEGLAAVQAVGMQPAFPFTVFADSRQRILTVKVGELHRDEAELILGQLAAVEAGTRSLSEARAEIDAGLKALAARRAAAEAAEKAAAAD